MTDYAKTSNIVEALRGLHLTSDRDGDFQDHLDRLLKRDCNGTSIPEPVRFGRTRETRGILVVDAPGGGKTTLVARGLAKHPGLQPREGGDTPYLISTVPSPANLKSVTSELLKQTEFDTSNSRRRVWELVDILRGRMDLLGKRILWIDEAHDLFCADRGSILRVVKSLMQGDDAVIVILSGTELLDEIVRSDPQVRRRFSVIRPAPLTVATDAARFEELLPSFCERAGLVPPAEPSLVPRLFHAARYRFGRAVEFLIDAIEQALLDPEEPRGLDLRHFASVWSMQEGPEFGRNVFLVGDWQRIDPDADPYVERRPVRSRRAGGRHA